MTLLLTLLLAGMWESAVRLDGALRHVVEEALAPGGCCEHFSLRVTGHSLGAGVASLLTIRWNQVYLCPTITTPLPTALLLLLSLLLSFACWRWIGTVA